MKTTTTQPRDQRTKSPGTSPKRVPWRDEQLTTRRPGRPHLRFTPYAWAKLVWFRDHGDTEIGGFGITPAPAPGENLLLIEDFVPVTQQASAVSVEFDDAAVADFFDQQVDAGRRPEQFLRVWLHTHPGDSAEPSFVDEETFERVFGRCDWAIMAIVGRGGQTYGRLRFGVGPGGEGKVHVEVDYGVAFAGSDHAAWEAEYDATVHRQALPFEFGPADEASMFEDPRWLEQFLLDGEEFGDEMDLAAAAEADFEAEEVEL